MMAISCLMIEALESFHQGWETSDGKSNAAFCSFFGWADPFKQFREYDQQFYKHVRCGILHQAETTGGWMVVRNGPLFEQATLTINATQFLRNLHGVLDKFCDDLKVTPWNSVAWKNVCKKMNTICENCRLNLKMR